MAPEQGKSPDPLITPVQEMIIWGMLNLQPDRRNGTNIGRVIGKDPSTVYPQLDLLCEKGVLTFWTESGG
jgi:hypothetical protein